MATLLYRLGRLAARRAWVVVVAWLLAIGLAVGGYLAAGETLSSAVTIPGTPTEEVTDQLAERFPGASGGTGTLVLSTDDGQEFTDAQQEQVAALLDDIGEIDGVERTTDPFATQAQREEQAQQLLDGQEQIEAARDQVAAGREEIEQGRTAIDDGQAQLDAGQTQLDQARAQAEQAGIPAALAAVEAQQAELDAQQTALDAQREQLEAGAAELETNAATLEEQAAAAEQGAALLALADGISTVSADGSTALAAVMFTEAQLDVAPETKEAVVDLVQGTDVDGVTVDVSQTITQEVPEILGVGEAVGVLIAAVTLLVVLGTFVAAGLPLINALVGVAVGVAGSLAFSGVVDMLSVTPVLGVMLALAVGIDYSLFILHRHRMQLSAGVDLHESIGLANGTSGNAVVFAGSTVLVALLALNVTGIPFLGMMGTVAAVCVAVSILVAITLTPALLALVGTRVLTRKARAEIGAPHTVTRTVTPMGTPRAVVTLVVGLAVLGVVALPALSMRLGLPDGSSEAEGSTQYRAFTITAEKFGAGANSPLLVVAELPEPVADEDLVAEQVRIGEQLAAQDDVVAVAPVGASEDGELLAFQVLPAEGPSSESTEALVHTLRGLSPLDGDVELGVAGTASGNIDISEKLSDALPLYLGLVVGLSLVIMVVVFRSVLVPVTATLGFVLSLLATFGGLTAIFQWGWLGPVFGVHDPGPILSFLPTILIGILFGLAMDYQLFLVSGMREAYAHGAPARLAVQRGVAAGRTVVTAAGIIMVAVFAGFVFSNSAIIRSLGFGLAFGVLLDAFVVRMLLIPAAMHLLGDKAWWIPAWLDNVLPDVDVEGASLERTHPGAHVTTGAPVADPAQEPVPGGPDHE